MNYLNQMYGSNKSTGSTAPVSNKNPNRVLGGLRGQGSDHYSMLGEDGLEREVPSRRYVQSLEQKIRDQDTRLAVLERKLRNVVTDQRMTAQAFVRKNNSA